MRTFIAIELPNEIKGFLGKLQNELRASGADVRWVAPENIHLTLKFLGELDEKEVGKAGEILEGIAGDEKSFQIRLCSLGAFPKLYSPRVIWVGIDEGDKEIIKIAKGLEDRLAKLGIPKKGKPFSSHITIGRMRSALNLKILIEGLQTLRDNFGQARDHYGELQFRVTKITLFKSTLTPKGPVYEALKEAALMTI